MDLTIVDDTYIIDSSATTASGGLKSTWLQKWQGAPIMDLTAENKEVAVEEPVEFAEVIETVEEVVEIKTETVVEEVTEPVETVEAEEAPKAKKTTKKVLS